MFRTLFLVSSLFLVGTLTVLLVVNVIVSAFTSEVMVYCDESSSAESAALSAAVRVATAIE